MNTKLPFKLSAIGLIGLLISQGAYAQTNSSSAPTTRSDLTIAAQGTEDSTIYVAPSNALADGNGTPYTTVYNGSQYFIFIPPDPMLLSGLENLGRITSADPSTLLTAFQSYVTDQIQGGSTRQAAVDSALSYFYLNNPTDYSLGSPAEGPIVPGGAITSSSNIASLVSGQLVNNGTPVSSSVSASVQSQVNGADGASFSVGPGNTVSAAATGNAQTLKQTLANGEGSAAVGLSDININGSNVSASLSSSSIGLSATGAVVGGSTTVNGNGASATAAGNNSSASLTAGGVNNLTGSDLAGVSSLSSLTNNFPDSGNSQVLSGNLLAGAVQALQDSNVTASNTNYVPAANGSFINTAGDAVIGVDLGNGGASLTDHNVTVSNNSAGASAGGNALSLSASDGLVGASSNSGAVKALAVGSLQSVNRSSISAYSAEQVFGIDDTNLLGGTTAATVSGGSLAVNGNQLLVQAQGNNVATMVASDQSNAADSLAVSNAQYFQGGGTGAPVQVMAKQDYARAGLNGDYGYGISVSGLDAVVSGNLLSTAATANTLSTSVQLAPGAVNGAGTYVSSVQSLAVKGSVLTVGSYNNQAVVGAASLGDGVYLPVTGSQLTVGGNQVNASAIGNDAQQAQGALSGSINAGIASSASQTVGAIGGGISIVADVYYPLLGSYGASDLSGTTLDVGGNGIGALAAGNRAVLTQQAIDGSVNGAAITLGSNQTTSAATSVEAEDQYVRVGAIYAQALAQTAPTQVQVSNNSLTAQADLNLSTLNGAGIGATLAGGTVAATQTQDAAGSVITYQDDNYLGVANGYETNVTAPIGANGNAFSLQVNGNTLSAVSAANAASQNLGVQTMTGPIAQSGVVDTASVLGGTLPNPSVSQTATGVSVTAEDEYLGLGAYYSGMLGRSAGATSFQVANNVVGATARENTYAETDTGFSGSVLGSFGSVAVQQGLGGALYSDVYDATLGFDDESRSSPSAFGATAAGTSLSVTGNQTRADTAANVANISLGGLSGSLGGSFGATALQNEGITTATSSASSIEAETEYLYAGLYYDKDGAVGTGGPVNLAVSGNQALTVASGNIANLALSGVSGPIAAGANASLSAQQNLLSTVTGYTYELNFSNLYTGDNGDVNPVTQTYTGNAVLTGTNGNSFGGNLGSLNGSLLGTVQTSARQNIAPGSSLSSENEDTYIGPYEIGAVGVGAASPVTVSNNQIVSSLNGNSAATAAALNGQLGGSLLVNEQQSIGTASVATGLSAENYDINFENYSNSNLGSGSVFTASNNLGLATAVGNGINDQIGGSVSAGGGTVAIAGIQSVSNTTVNSEIYEGYVFNSGENETTPSAATANLSGNQLTATTVSNQSLRSVAVNGTLPDLTVNINQLNSGVTASSETEYAEIYNYVYVMGANSNTTANNNLISSGTTGNSINDQVSATLGVGSGAVALGTGINSGQTAVNSTISAEIYGGEVFAEVYYSEPQVLNGTLSGNQIVSSVVSNQAVHSVALNGVLPVGSALNLADNQFNNTVTVSSELDKAEIGGYVEEATGTALPVNLAMSNNAFLAQAVGDSVSQTVSLTGLSVASTAMTSLMALQNNTGSSVTAVVTNSQVGYYGTGTSVTAPVTGNIAISGNTVAGVAVGNQASLTRH